MPVLAHGVVEQGSEGRRALPGGGQGLVPRRRRRVGPSLVPRQGTPADHVQLAHRLGSAQIPRDIDTRDVAGTSRFGREKMQGDPYSTSTAPAGSGHAAESY